jgi:predicted nucleic acid-binding protein
MKKQKICFDTSAICSLFDNSQNTPVVVRMFDFIDHNAESFNLFASPIFYIEVNQSQKKLFNVITAFLATSNIVSLTYSINAVQLTESYLQKQVLTKNHWHDLAHLAYASVCSCDYFISCDRKHIVRQKTIDYVKNINIQQNIFVPQIVTPSTFLEIQNG